jgi:hypothetical protein
MKAHIRTRSAAPSAPDGFGAVGAVRVALGAALLGVLVVSPLVGQEEGDRAEAHGERPDFANPHGRVVEFLFPGLPFQVLELSRDQRIRMARRTARLHRGYGHDLHHLYHGGGVDGLFRQLPHLRDQVRTYRRTIVDGILTRGQRKELAAAFDEEAFERNRHGYRVLRLVLGDDVIHDYYGIPDKHGVGTNHIGFKDAHGPGHGGRDHDRAGGPPPN